MSATEINVSELIALRRFAHLIPAVGHHHQASRLLGGHLSSQRGRGMEFAETRAYHAGDDIRRMDWRVTARTGQPHTKLYQEERERPVYFIVDYSPSCFFATRGALKSLQIARSTALLAWAYANHGDRIGGMIFTADDTIELRPKSRKQGVLPLLHHCALHHQSVDALPKTVSWSERLQQCAAVIKPGSLIIVLSDFLTLGTEDLSALRHLRQHNEMLALWFRDPIECQVPPPQRYPVQYGDQNTFLDLTQASVREQYQQFFDQREQCIVNVWQQTPAKLCRLLTTDIIHDVLPTLLRHREVEHANAS